MAGLLTAAGFVYDVRSSGPAVTGPRQGLERWCPTAECPQAMANRLFTKRRWPEGGRGQRRSPTPCTRVRGGQPVVPSSHDVGGGARTRPPRHCRRPPAQKEEKERTKGKESLWLSDAPVRKIILQMHTPARTSQCGSRQTPAWTRRVHLDAPGQRHGQQPRPQDSRPPE